MTSAKREVFVEERPDGTPSRVWCHERSGCVVVRYVPETDLAAAVDEALERAKETIEAIRRSGSLGTIHRACDEYMAEVGKHSPGCQREIGWCLCFAPRALKTGKGEG